MKQQSSNRGIVVLAAFGFILVLYIIRLLYLQVLSPEYSIKADAHDLERVTLYPSRGIIYDRENRLYVINNPIFDVEFIPNQITIPDTSVLEEYLGLSREKIRTEIQKHTKTARYQWQTLATKLDEETYGRFSEHSWQFEGIRIVTRPTRAYKFHAGAHFLGYLSKPDSNYLLRARQSDDYDEYPYVGEDLVGKIGIEAQYEKKLRGKKGSRIILRDVYKREMDSYADGQYDEMPQSGTDIKLGIDAKLQEFGERLMQNKRGSIVAIEPSTGEILAFISAPAYDPSLLTGSNLGENYLKLSRDPQLPLVNRPLSAQYPPGSIFKLLQALVALSEGVITPETRFRCGGAWFRNRGKPACHGAHGSVDLAMGIKHSCNSYFAEVYYTFLNDRRFRDINMSYPKWFELMDNLGIGRKLGVDVPDEKTGNLPKKETYDKTYGKNSWGALTIYSNSIGQGEILLTPLQMANSAALIANRGWYYPPHFMIAEKAADGSWLPTLYNKIETKRNAAHYQVVVDAMEQVVLSGTGTRARIDSIAVCGKTGTVENKAGEDHSVFLAFAPKEKPKIAIAAIIENAGFGGTWAGPICALMMEYHIKGSIKDENKLQRILDQSFDPIKKDEPKKAEGPNANKEEEQDGE